MWCLSFCQADANLGMEQRHFVQASLEYILKLQEVQERKKFEFVETVSTSFGHSICGSNSDPQILSFMYGWLTFYHQGELIVLQLMTRSDMHVCGRS
jgi:hypothetical protein